MLERLSQRIDATFLIVILLIMSISIITLYSSVNSAQSYKADLYRKQMLWFVVGTALMILTLLVDYHLLSAFSYIIYGASIVALIFTLIFGKHISGSKSWITLGPFNIQSSELCKVSVILLLATFLNAKRGEKLGFFNVLGIVAIVGIPLCLILLQPDLGTALTYLPIAFVSMFLSGIRFRTLLTLFLIMIVMAPVVWLNLKDYQRERIFTILDPSRDPSGSGYQLIQSKIAIGSGMLFGKGLFSNTQSRLDFLPAQHTDFILSVFGEVAGFAGISFAILLYAILFNRMIDTARVARDRLGLFISIGVLSMIAFQAFINMGMVVGLLPTIGIPLPLLSYGGSSVVSTMMALGLVMNVRMNRFAN
ncbi:MAG: rod shape-determining protein RodA [Acidobacteriota bacterium]